MTIVAAIAIAARRLDCVLEPTKDQVRAGLAAPEGQARHLTVWQAARDDARMKRTTISLPDDVAAALEREAARRRTSVSHIAREAIEARLGWDQTGPPYLGLIGMFDTGGEFGSLSEYVDSDEFKKEYADWIHRDAFDRDP